jgi:predicted nucleic acid-binding protein
VGESKIYDTSAIIELARRRATRRAPYVSIITVIEYPPAVGYAENILYPTRRDYNLAIAWQSKLRALGSPLPATDLVIVAQAVNDNMVLVARDKHFKTLKETVAGNLQLEMLV